LSQIVITIGELYERLLASEKEKNELLRKL